MIYITQGHEKSIGLEVFLKSFILLTSKNQLMFTLVTDESTLIENLKLLNLKYSIENSVLSFSGNSLQLILTTNEELPQSTTSLSKVLEVIKEGDILLTLPTSKDQLILNNEICKGYTEYLRSFYKDANLCMLFKAMEDNTLLITDHIPLKEVGSAITKELITKKVRTTLMYLDKYFQTIDEVVISGINPHCGEGGLLGTEDKSVYEAVTELSESISVVGPVSGDTLHFHKDTTKKQLNVYMYHDQGLPVFKNKYKTIGLNITLGLPFIRMSVDHGTAFDLYGRGKADYSGCYYMLKEAIKLGKINGRK